jgi:hypothetical protein
MFPLGTGILISEWCLRILIYCLWFKCGGYPYPDFELPLELQNEEESEFDPEPPKVPISILGDVYEMRSLQEFVHRVICGDSRLPEVYDELLREII